MARSYHVDIAQVAAAANRKWVDNLLSHFDLPGVDGGTRGLARRLTLRGIYHVALVRRLSEDLDIGLGRAVVLARHLLATDAVHVEVGAGVSLRLDRETFEREIDRAVADAAESIVPARRGRPPKRG